MKEMYVPTMDELYLMQDMGSNIYRYLVAKAAERLILEGVNTPNKGMLKTAYKYLRENYDVASAVCTLYPEEIEYSSVLKYDSCFCLKLLKDKKPLDNSLDNLSYFDETALNNIPVVNRTIVKLDEVLKDNPKYRFTYKQSKLLDDIFLGRVNFSNITSDKLLLMLSAIEPAYATKYNGINSKEYVQDLNTLLKVSIDHYSTRYNLPYELGQEYKNKDILTNQPTEVKRLIKCINNK